MASGIVKRTVFYDNTDGVKRFWDWALARTSLGTMAEPFVANNRHSVGTVNIQFDPTDMISRIDDIKEADIDQSLLLLSGGDEQIHGGTLIPRTGR